MKIFTILTALLLLSANVFAEDKNSFYTSGSIGFAFPSGGWEAQKSTLDLDAGFQGTLAIGKVINKYFKAELEYNRKGSGLTDIKHEGKGTFTNPINGKKFDDKKDINLEGTVRVNALMVNSYITLPRKKDSWFSPYIGMGYGVAWQETKATLTHTKKSTITDDQGNQKTTSERVRLGGGDWKFNETDFAYQVFAGNTWELFDILQSEIGYTYFHTANIQTHGTTFKLIYAF